MSNHRHRHYSFTSAAPKHKAQLSIQKKKTVKREVELKYFNEIVK